jgi:hypothetical protein
MRPGAGTSRHGGIGGKQGPGKTRRRQKAGKGDTGGVDSEGTVGKEPGQGLTQPLFQRMGKGTQEAAAGGVLEFPEQPRRGMTEYGRAALLPEIDKAASTPAFVPASIPAPAACVEAKVTGTEHRGKEAERREILLALMRHRLSW